MTIQYNILRNDLAFLNRQSVLFLVNLSLSIRNGDICYNPGFLKNHLLHLYIINSQSSKLTSNVVRLYATFVYIDFYWVFKLKNLIIILFAVYFRKVIDEDSIFGPSKLFPFFLERRKYGFKMSNDILDTTVIFFYFLMVTFTLASLTRANMFSHSRENPLCFSEFFWLEQIFEFDQEEIVSHNLPETPFSTISGILELCLI